MIRRILIGALVVMLVQTSLPVSVSAQQPAPAKQTTSAASRVYPDLTQVKRPLDLQNATRVLSLTGATPLQPTLTTLRQTTSDGGPSKTKQRIIMWSIIAGAGIGILALENIAPKGNDARCSSANPQFCN